MRSVPPLVFVALLGSAACAPASSAAFISGNVPLTAECAPGDSTVVISTGRYDVLKAGTKKTTCLQPYMMALAINSNLQSNANLAVGRAETNALLVNYADVTLMDKNESILSFPADKSGNVPPNPYRVYTAVSIAPSRDENPSKGVVQIDAIPTAYAEVLRGLAGDSILVEVQLFGKTTGNVSVDFSPFLYPLSICSDCLSTCRNDSKWSGTGASMLTDINANKCTDNRAQDDRTCVDPC